MTTSVQHGLRVLHTRPTRPLDGAPPVIVLHGWGASIDAVGSITGGLAERFEVVAVDLPGFGESPPPPRGWTVDDYADCVRDLAASLGFERYVLIGHSFGARISIALAARGDEGVVRMVLTGAAGLKPKRKPSYYGKVGMAKAGRVAAAVGGKPGKDLQQKIRGKVASSDWLNASEAMRDTFRLVIAEDLAPRLASIRVPTLLIWGDGDEDTPLWMGQAMEQGIKDAGLVVLPGGHYAYAEQAGQFNRIVAHFLGDR